MKKLLLSLVLLAASPAFAQTNLVLTTTAANGGQTIPTLTWSNPTATSCSASGDPAWSNSANKPVSGTVTLPAVGPPNVRSYTLTCSSTVDNKATISWTAPTTNTDNSPYTNPKGYKLYRGSNATNLTSFNSINSPTTLSFVDTNLAPGKYFYGVTAVNTGNVESAMSNTASKTIVLNSTDSQTVSLAFPGTTILTVN